MDTAISLKESPALPAAAEDENLGPVFAAVAKYFALLSDPTRLRILHTICRSEHHVSAIVAATGASQTNVSRHLALLHQAGVVSRRKVRNSVFYKVADPMFADVCRTVCVQMAKRIDAHAPLREELLAFASRH
ncbi:MAG TPA: metalloregulator ArsR/SmtB family transcription factor [Casimicrobiaceae bacterium]